MRAIFRAGVNVAVHPRRRNAQPIERLCREAFFQRLLERLHPEHAVAAGAGHRHADIRVAVTGAGSNGVLRVKSFEEALKKRLAAKSLDGLSIPVTGMNSDIHASPEYRAHLVGVLARRAVAKATA